MIPKMTLKTGLLTAALGLATLPAIAFAALSEGDVIGTSEAEIRAALKAEGYVVHGIEIEAEVTLNGMAFEIELSTETGEILEIEAEDDDYKPG